MPTPRLIVLLCLILAVPWPGLPVLALAASDQAQPAAQTSVESPAAEGSAAPAAATVPAMAPAGDGNQAPDTAGDPSSDTYQAWMSVFEQRERSLQNILASASPDDPALFTRMQSLSDDVENVNAAFQQQLAMLQISQSRPMESGLVADQLERLGERLEESLKPWTGLEDRVSAALDEVDRLDVNLDGADSSVAHSEAARDYAAHVEKAKRDLSAQKLRLQYALAPARVLQNQMRAQHAAITEQLPGLWKRYYLSSSQRFFNPDGWKQITTALHTFLQTFGVRVEAQMPQSLRETAQVVFRALVTLTFLWGLTVFARRTDWSRREDLRPGLDRLYRHALPWLYGGIGLYVAAWAPHGNPYLLLIVCGTILLSFGQVRLAWSVRVFTMPEQSHHSPLGVIFLPVLIGLVLLFINLPPEPLAVLWIIALLCFLRHKKGKTAPAGFTLEKNILQAHTIMLWAAVGVTLAGWGRLSILLCMLFAMIAVCVQMAVGFVKLSNRFSETMPRNGLRGLVIGVVLALVVPVLLVIFCLSMGFWILAFPGGTFLLNQLAAADINLGQRSLNFIQILLIISVFYITRSAITVGKYFLRQLPARGVRLDQTLVAPFQLIYTYLLWALFALYVLSALGFSLTSLAVIVGGFSVGVGVGMQSVINNFVSGLMLIFSQNIREGDVVEIGGILGVVRRVSIRTTTVETYDNSTVFVPNANLLTNNLINWTRNGRTVRRDLNVSVAYGSDIRKVLEILTKVPAKHPKVLQRPVPEVSFSNFADNSLQFVLRVWFQLADETATMNDLRLNIAEAFAREGIEMASPQVDVHFPDGQPGPREAAGDGRRLEAKTLAGAGPETGPKSGGADSAAQGEA